MECIVNGFFNCCLSVSSDTSYFEKMLNGHTILIIFLVLSIYFSDMVFSAKKVNITNIYIFQLDLYTNLFGDFCSFFQKNEMTFQRLICKPGNSTTMIVKKCWMKRADRIGTDRVSLFIETDIVKPLKDLKIRVTAYYKYSVFRKLPIDVQEDICAWTHGKRQSFILEWTFRRAEKFMHYDGRLKCPLIGNYTVSINNISLNEQFPMIPLLPSGYYYTENVLTDVYDIITTSKFYFSISDNRIEQY